MIAVLLTIVGVISRLLPHLPNFTPVGSAALFGGTYLNKKWALVLPILIMVISDYFIGFDNLTSRLYVYTALLLGGLIGLWLRKNKSTGNIVLGTFVSSLFFFLITNFGVWAHSGMYERSLTGLLQSYLMGLPFFRNTLLGDFFYTGVLFGAYEVSVLILSKKKLTATI